jgi:hypothetical protein
MDETMMSGYVWENPDMGELTVECEGYRIGSASLAWSGFPRDLYYPSVIAPTGERFNLTAGDPVPMATEVELSGFDHGMSG